MDEADREREACKLQAFTFYTYAQAAPNKEAQDAWRAAEAQMEMASLCLAPAGIARHRSNAAIFVRAAQAAEAGRPPQSPPAPSLEEAEAKRKAAQAVINEKRERTRLANLKKKFGEP